MANFFKKTAPTNVLMERSYLKSWREFFARTANVEETLTSLLAAHDPSQARFLESNMSALRALSACKFSAPTLRKKIYANIESQKKQLALVGESQILIDGLVGIAHGSDRSHEATFAAGAIANAFTKSRIERLKFSEKVELLNAVCTTDLLETADSKNIALRVVTDTVQQLDDLWFDNTENELSLDNFEKLRESYLTIKLSSDAAVRKVNFKNKNLLSALESPEVQLLRYPEFHSAAYDPLKPRVVSGIAAGLSSASMEILH